MYKNIILGLSLIILANCNAQKETKSLIAANDKEKSETLTKNEGNIIYFNEGENKFLKEYEMNVTFKGVSEDSRCPKDVNCIWAGVAVAQVEVMGIATRPMTLSLASMDNKGRNYHKSTNFNGYKISLVSVSPYPESQSTKELSGKYRIGIEISKDESQTNSTMK